MTTRSGFFNGRQAKNQGQLKKEGSGVKCHRCHNEIWKNGGFFYKVKAKPQWLPFCREDCAKLHVGKEAKLLTYEQYIAHLILSR